ncbi:RsmB/NOP family class I SAM-dependent RNA methyltransferase [Microbacterium gorillae]|uniref:RsmB/NOP family class I SAM-dependent RNA methyltransferase n=1 Tax=Microbacterium gorillae TaxID=1231063 RepID=UPI000590B4DA|nr:transcription antitermination factor NusB [Microbacterium gorillae]
MTAVSPARAVAYDVIRAVTSSDAYANLLLPTAITRAGLSGADAGLATELTYGTLRRLGLYDAVIEIAADRPTSRIKPEVLDALRLGAHQVLATRVAAHAAVNETVNLARGAGGQKVGGFANAVMRRITERSADEWIARLEQDARSDDERLAVTSAHPVWILRALRRALKAEGRADELEDLLEADNAAPQVTMIALPGLAEVPEDAQRTPYSPDGFRLAGGAPDPLVRRSKGTLRVQDEGSQLVALALAGVGEARSGERWLDLCAGPGGKTALLAARAREVGATLEANEITPARANLVRQAVEPVPGEVLVHTEDGRDYADEHPGAYDRILVDAPCTGLGALRRRPEARWRKQPADVGDLVPVQTGLVDAALRAVKPGGVVAYVTCSPHLAETTGVVADVLRQWDGKVEELDARAAIQSVARTELDLPAPEDGSGHAQLWPHRHNTDAMFLSLLRRTS